MIKIITDTTSCLPSEFARRNAITIIPQIVSFGEQSFYEGTQIDQDTFMKRLKTSNVPPAIVTHGGPGILAVSFFI